MSSIPFNVEPVIEGEAFEAFLNFNDRLRENFTPNENVRFLVSEDFYFIATDENAYPIKKGKILEWLNDPLLETIVINMLNQPPVEVVDEEDFIIGMDEV